MTASASLVTVPLHVNVLDVGYVQALELSKVFPADEVQLCIETDPVMVLWCNVGNY